MFRNGLSVTEVTDRDSQKSLQELLQSGRYHLIEMVQGKETGRRITIENINPYGLKCILWDDWSQRKQYRPQGNYPYPFTFWQSWFNTHTHILDKTNWYVYQNIEAV